MGCQGVGDKVRKGVVEYLAKFSLSHLGADSALGVVPTADEMDMLRHSWP